MTREEAKGIIYNEVLEATAMLATWENTEEEAECLERFIEASNMAIEALSHERPKGQWVCLEAEIGYYACSECDHRILRAKCNYCPNCGADMAELPNCGADMREIENE